MGVYADLHVHTDASDGALALADLPAAAADAGVGVIAVTDHDRIHPRLDAPVVRREGVTVVAGVELRVAAPRGRVDLLGYGARRAEPLAGLLDRVQADRVERGRAIVERVEDRLGVDLDVTVERGFGRPHVARAVAAHPDLDYTVGGVFDDLIGAGRPCYVERDVPTFEEGVAALDAACGLVALAHPLRYPDPAAALALCSDLDAVEGPYPYGGDPDRAPVERAAERHGLVVTGGSDAHGERVGAAGLGRAALAPVAARIG
ncbi:MAG: PHP domain-containing protein [Halobacteriaceae archaeon]